MRTTLLWLYFPYLTKRKNDKQAYKLSNYGLNFYELFAKIC